MLCVICAASHVYLCIYMWCIGVLSVQVPIGKLSLVLVGPGEMELCQACFPWAISLAEYILL